MARELISATALQAMIDEKLASLDECRSLQASISHDLLRTRGANWGVTSLRHSLDDRDHLACEEALAGLIAELRERYDIADW